MVKIIDIKCPNCQGLVVFGEITKFNNYIEDYLESVSQAIYCMVCNKKFEVIFVPVKIIERERDSI